MSCASTFTRSSCARGPNATYAPGEMLGLKAPKQPDGVGCGVCVLIMIELITTEGVGALYDLDKQCEILSASGHTEVVIDTTKVYVQWTEHYTNTKRIGYACRLANRQGARSR